MKTYEQQRFTGERALYQGRDLQIYYSTFADGESPLKESKNIELYNSLFQWKYPLWYSRDILVEDSTLYETARSGIWYTHNITINNSTIEAPKTFRRSSDIYLNNVTMLLAQETLWNCNHIVMKEITARGDYFGMNSRDIEIQDFNLTGNYAFDGGKNIVIRNAKMLSKDAFWNCENVTVYDSFISGEYLGWNSKNVTFINCTIESEQGLCYMENLVMEDCRLLNTNLAFEYTSANAKIENNIDSVKNPISGVIKANDIGEIIYDNPEMDKKNTKIIMSKG